MNKRNIHASSLAPRWGSTLLFLTRKGGRGIWHPLQTRGADLVTPDMFINGSRDEIINRETVVAGCAFCVKGVRQVEEHFPFRLGGIPLVLGLDQSVLLLVYSIPKKKSLELVCGDC